MSVETRLGLAVLGTALLLGALADGLLREAQLGLNYSLWIAAFVAALVLLAAWRGVPLDDGRRWMLPLLVVFGALFSWRDSAWLLGLDLFAIMTALGLGVLHNPGVRPQLAGLGDHARGWLTAAGAGFGGVVKVLADVTWAEVPRGGRSRQFTAVARGLAVAVPLLLLFGAFFEAADAAFDQLLGDLVPGLDGLDTHIVLFISFAWVSAGLLRQYLAAAPAAESRKQRTGKPRRPALELGAIELGIVLGALNLLFLAFVLVQLRYFFGGSSRVERTTGLTYADYAREGFFELVTVAALVLAVLLLVDWLRQRTSRLGERIFRALSATLIVLLFVVMASALQRMRLYQREYGLTELRLYTTAFMLFLAVVFVWFVVTVMRGQRERFAVGMLAAGLVSIFVLHAINPDALIARTNIQRAREGKRFDVSYLERLSADATPTIARELPALVRTPGNLRTEAGYVAQQLLDKADSPEDWRSWSWSRARANDSVSEHRAELEAFAQPELRFPV